MAGHENKKLINPEILNQMKKKLYFLMSGCALLLSISACHKDHNVAPSDPNTGATFSTAGDQVGRPGVNIVFINAAQQDKFNATAPSAQGAAYQSTIQSRLMALNPGFTTNAAGLSATAFSQTLATDVLNVSTAGTTSYGTFTGRGLADDVIDASFKLIWGGPDGNSNPGLVSDHVDHNDKPFLSTFPYEAAPW
jgi:hypothetical protein